MLYQIDPLSSGEIFFALSQHRFAFHPLLWLILTSSFWSPPHCCCCRYCSRQPSDKPTYRQKHLLRSGRFPFFHCQKPPLAPTRATSVSACRPHASPPKLCVTARPRINPDDFPSRQPPSCTSSISDLNFYFQLMENCALVQTKHFPPGSHDILSLQILMATQNFTLNYDDFLRCYLNYHNSDSTTSVAHTGNSSIFLS